MTATNHDDQLGGIYPTMLNELNCTFGVNFTRFHCWSRHGHGLWPSWFVAIMVCGRHGIGPDDLPSKWLFLYTWWHRTPSILGLNCGWCRGRQCLGFPGQVAHQTLVDPFSHISLHNSVVRSFQHHGQLPASEHDKQQYRIFTGGGLKSITIIFNVCSKTDE